ncbi:MAG: response regulator [Myxococcales bacterium]|nr:response regulator [Myxococcales bacterium]
MPEAHSPGPARRAPPGPLDRLIPPEVLRGADVRERLRYRGFAMTALVIAGTQSALMLAYFAFRDAPSTLEAIALGFGWLYPFGFALLLRYARQIDRVNILMASFALLASTAYVAVSGGLLSPGLSLFAIIPTTGFAVGGRQVTVRYAAATIAALLLIIALSLLDALPTSTLTSAPELELHGIFMVHCVVLVALSSYSTSVSRSRASRALRRARAEAERASVAKSRFLAVMSHELRTPLTGVLGSIELLAGVSDKPEQREYIDVLRSSAEALLTVINDILDFSRVEAGKLELRPKVFEPAALVSEVERLFLPVAQQRGLELVTEVDALGHRRADASRLRQVLMNLVGNALKFTTRGRVTIRARALSTERARFEVEDTGVGIAPEEQQQLFQPFSQLDVSSTRAREGTGLGLAICRALVEAMGGTIGLSSRVGEGSRFYFEIACPTASAVDQPGASASSSRRSTRALRILVAEDSAVAVVVIRRLLERLGHEVELVSDGEAAVAAVGSPQARRFDLVLMDMHMPRLDGLGATRAIRALPGDRGALPIYAFSADALGQRDDYRDIGLDGYLLKPIELDALERVLERVGAGAGRRASD